MRKIKVASANRIARLFIADATSTSGAGLNGVLYNSSGLACYYAREGAASPTAVSLVTATMGTYTSGGFVTLGTNMAGVYEFGVPSAAFASGSKSCIFYFCGAANMVPVTLEVELDAVDYQDGNAFGLAVLPASATPGTLGGLVIGDASGAVALTPNTLQQLAGNSNVATVFITGNATNDGSTFLGVASNTLTGLLRLPSGNMDCGASYLALNPYVSIIGNGANGVTTLTTSVSNTNGGNCFLTPKSGGLYANFSFSAPIHDGRGTFVMGWANSTQMPTSYTVADVDCLNGDSDFHVTSNNSALGGTCRATFRRVRARSSFDCFNWNANNRVFDLISIYEDCDFESIGNSVFGGNTLGRGVAISAGIHIFKRCRIAAWNSVTSAAVYVVSQQPVTLIFIDTVLESGSTNGAGFDIYVSTNSTVMPTIYAKNLHYNPAACTTNVVVLPIISPSSIASVSFQAGATMTVGGYSIGQDPATLMAGSFTAVNGTLATLSTAVSSVPGAVWTVGTRALTDKANFTLASAYDPAKTAAQPGAKMDLVDAPNATAVLALNNGMATSTSLSTLSNKFTGMTSLSSWLRHITRKDYDDAGALAEINANIGAGTGTWDHSTESLQGQVEVGQSYIITNVRSGLTSDHGSGSWQTGSGGGGGILGPGADHCTVTISHATIAIAQAQVWISTDQAGTSVIAGTLSTDSNGHVTFLLTAGDTYYLWARKDGWQGIQGRQFTAVAD